MTNSDVTTDKSETAKLMTSAAATGDLTISDFDTLYRECRPELVHYADRRGARDAELLADLALLDIHRALPRLRSNHRRVIWAYLYRAIDNHLRRELSAFSPELRNDLEDLGNSATFEDDVVANMSLEDMLALLSPGQQDALRPKLEEGLSSADIGARVGKSSAAVRQLQRQAIRRLRRILFVAVTVIIVVLAAITSNRDVVVDQSPATSGTEQAPTETTVADPPMPTVTSPVVRQDASASESTALVATTVSAPAEPSSTATAAVPDVSPTSVTTEVPATAEPITETADVANPLLGSFALVNLGSEKCVDQPSSQEDGGQVIQWRCAGHTALNQIFQGTEGNGGVMLVFAHSGKCLDESFGVVSQFRCHGGANQLFNLSGSQVQSKDSGWCLTVADESLADGATLHTEPCVNSSAQQFRLERYGTQLPAG